jgi:hypothetical protein
MVRRRALLLAGLLALLLAANAQALSPYNRHVRARARADAASALAGIQLPPGATTVRRDPGVHRLVRLGIFCTPRYVVDRHSFWRVPGGPADVWSWIADHPPASNYGGVGTSRSEPGPFQGFVYFQSRDTKRVEDRQVIVAVADAKGGGTAVRIDSQDAWVPHSGQGVCWNPGGY